MSGDPQKLRILMIATFHSRPVPYRAITKDLADRLEGRGHHVVRSSVYYRC